MEKKIIKKYFRDIVYCLPAFSFAIPTFPVMIFLPALYSEDYGIPIISVGVIIFFAKIVDIISDPIMGLVNDVGFLKRKWWMFIGSIVCGISLFCLFIPSFTPNVIYLGIFISLLYIGWTMFQVPYLSFGYDLEKDYFGRTRISATREFFILMGLTSSVLLPVLFSVKQSEVIITYLALASGFVSLTMFLLLLREPKRKNTKSRPRISLLMKNKVFVRLVFAWFVNCLANVFPTVLFVFFITYVVGGDDAVRDKILLYYFLSAFLGMPLWLWISKFLEKKSIWIVSMISSVLFFSLVFFVGKGDVGLFIFISILTGICLGADLAIPPSIQSDLVDHHKSIFGEDVSGLFFSFLTLINKLAFGIASIISFSLLDFFQFQTNSVASDSVRNLLYFLYAGLPILLKLIASYLIWKFPLSKKNSQNITKKLYG